SCSTDVGRTTIEKWPDGKRAAVSITFDGGTTNQFAMARPIMDELGLPATFFIVTGDIKGSEFRRTFIGRPVAEIADEVTRGVPTTEDNFFERAGAVRMLPYREAIDYHTRAGDLFELGRIEEAYATIDEAYRRADEGSLTTLEPGDGPDNPDVNATWNDLSSYASRGHEFASHSVSHAQLATLDSLNLIYELERSLEEIETHLGTKHTFSVEAPYGTENPRVMERVLALYPASRNRMPEAYLEEINRWNDADPRESPQEYVQWQRGPKSATSVREMISWVDRAASADNVWLVLVFHGVEGIGWEPKPAAELQEYFTYIAGSDEVWVGTFGDAARYIRERMAATVTATRRGDEIRVDLRHSLDSDLYRFPLTLSTRVPADWTFVEVTQGASRHLVDVRRSSREGSVTYRAVPNSDVVVLRQATGT
ncbi:MAG: polysaccharide deacetylase family protein, partial [Rhodothermales bacterium]|nr:polysaccharide deacetylase family protein [Rhodothermales bacterium]